MCVCVCVCCACMLVPMWSGVLPAFVSVCWGVCAFLPDVCVCARACVCCVCVCSFACCACTLVRMCVRLQCPMAGVRACVHACLSVFLRAWVCVCLCACPRPHRPRAESAKTQVPSSKFQIPSFLGPTGRSAQEHLPRWTACLSLFSPTGRTACRPLHREASSMGDWMAPLAGDRG